LLELRFVMSLFAGSAGALEPGRIGADWQGLVCHTHDLIRDHIGFSLKTSTGVADRQLLLDW